MEGQASSHKIHVLDNRPELYYTKRFRKKKRGVRVIHAPSPELKVLQKEFADWFYQQKKDVFDQNPQITGFMPEKSIADNALPHLNKDWVLNLDVKDFFPSTQDCYVFGALNSLPKSRHPFDWLKTHKPVAFKRMSSEMLNKVLTLDGGLPQGSPASPMLSNYVAIKEVDYHVRRTLMIFGKKHISDIAFTRYADDITISFNGGNRQWAKEIIKDIEISLVHDSIYKIKPQKTIIKHRSQRQLVTGVLVNGDNTKIDRRLMNKMRAIIHNARRDGRELDAETRGMLAFIQSINKQQYDKLIN